MVPKKDPNDLLKLENDFYVKPRINGKRKGASYERQLAKKLNLITPENFKFVIEAKRGYDITLEDLWKPKSNFFKFIEQARRDGRAAQKPWLLVYKKDRQKEIVICEHQFDMNERALINSKYYIYLLDDLLKLEDSEFMG